MRDKRLEIVVSLLTVVGEKTLAALEQLGAFFLFLMRVIRTTATRRPHFKQILNQMNVVGVGSFVIIVLTGCFTGLALALQSWIGFSRVGAEEFIGLVVTLGMTRELGPVLSGLMVTGRVGSAMAAEIGSMQITEQIDALRTLCIDPFHYLIAPRIIATTVIMPFLTVFSMISGILGGYFFCTIALGLNAETYLGIIQERVVLSDIMGGLIKSACFGLILSWVGTYNGYTTSGGAQGVGRSTTRSVVIGSILILMSNYFLSSFLSKAGIA